MMKPKINVYIVTYKRNDVLNANLASLWAATDDLDGISVTVLSNDPGVLIEKEHERDQLSVVVNPTRSRFSWGNLARDWNWSMLDAFGTWRNPNDVAWCVCAQNDVTWVPGWDRWLRQNTSYDLVTQPVGDQSFAISIDGLLQVGFFDERFSTLQFHEQDWFTRARISLGDRVSIDDSHTPETVSHHPVGAVLTYSVHSAHELANHVDATLHSTKHHAAAATILRRKWRFDGSASHFLSTTAGHEHTATMADDLPTEINWYPFFWDGVTVRTLATKWFAEHERVVVTPAEVVRADPLQIVNDFAVIAYGRGEHFSAARLLLAVLEADPDHSDARHNIGAVVRAIAGVE